MKTVLNQQLFVHATSNQYKELNNYIDSITKRFLNILGTVDNIKVNLKLNKTFNKLMYNFFISPSSAITKLKKSLISINPKFILSKNDISSLKTLLIQYCILIEHNDQMLQFNMGKEEYEKLYNYIKKNNNNKNN